MKGKVPQRALPAFSAALSLAFFAVSSASFAAENRQVAAALAWAKQELANPIDRTPDMKGEAVLKYQEQQRIQRALGSCERGSRVSCSGLVLMHEQALALADAQKSVSEASLAVRAKGSVCGPKSAEPECLVLTHLAALCGAGDQPTCDRLNTLKARVPQSAPCAPENRKQNSRMCFTLEYQCNKNRIQESCDKLAALSGAGGTGDGQAPAAALPNPERSKRIEESRSEQQAANAERAAPPPAAHAPEPSAEAAAQPSNAQPDAEAKAASPAEQAAPAAGHEDADRAAALAWARDQIASPIAKPVVNPAELEAYKRAYQRWYRQQELVEYLGRCDQGSETGCAVVTKLYQDAVAAGDAPAM